MKKEVTRVDKKKKDSIISGLLKRMLKQIEKAAERSGNTKSSCPS